MRRATLRPLTIVLGLLVASPALTTEVPRAAPSELEKALDAFSSFHLAEAGRHVKDAHLPVGHLTVSIADGTVTLLRAKDGSIAGVYVTGTGGWTYKAEVASERAVLETNKARVAGGIRTRMVQKHKRRSIRRSSAPRSGFRRTGFTCDGRPCCESSRPDGERQTHP